MTKAQFSGSSEQLLNAMDHMAQARPITKAEKAIVREAADVIKEAAYRIAALEAQLAEAKEALEKLDNLTARDAAIVVSALAKLEGKADE